MATPPQGAGPQNAKRPGGHRATGQVEQFEARNGRAAISRPSASKAYSAMPKIFGTEQATSCANCGSSRLVVRFSYKFKIALIKFVGTHEEYEGINAETA
jgi:mRNA-degrading endonuclease HigB of HigAB toxin-antitoxin module